MLTEAQRDRARGVLLATAAGDALGAGYEFGPPLPDDVAVRMRGGGSFHWAAGEWTDDTSMAIAIAEVAGAGLDLGTDAAQDRIVARWVDWARTAADVGNQTRAVLSGVAIDAGHPAGAASRARSAAKALHARTGHTGGNGSLMRTAPVALAYLDDEDALIHAARSISTLTHADADAGDACVLWCLAIHRAVLTGAIDVRAGLARLDPPAHAEWAVRLDVAAATDPREFAHNGWVVEALQAAYSAIVRTLSGAGHLAAALEAAVRGGRDTDTVAAIAGGLLGAAYGASAVPAEWRAALHGWPGLQADDLVALADRIVAGPRSD